MADLLGRRRVFMAGLILFALASLAGGLAQSDGPADRGARRAGPRRGDPLARGALDRHHHLQDGAERNKALGVWGAVAGSGGAAGVLLGGVLTDTLGWEWVLWVNVPIGIAAALLAPRLLAESRARGARRATSTSPARSPSRPACRCSSTRSSTPTTPGWGSAADDRPARDRGRAAGRVRRRSSALARRRWCRSAIFRLRTLTGANVVGLLVGASLFSMFFFFSLYMQQVLGYSALKAGLSYLPLALAIIVSAGHRLAARHPDRLQAGAGRRAGADHRRPGLVRPDLGRTAATSATPRAVAARRASGSASRSCR